MIANQLAKYSIKQQILIGLLPMVAILFFLVVLSAYKSSVFNENLNKLEAIRKEALLYDEVKFSIKEMQRNILVYSYIGYSGILKKIDFTQEGIEENLQILSKLNADNDSAKDRLIRLEKNYTNYKEAFAEAVRKRKQISATKLKLSTTASDVSRLLDALEEKNQTKLWSQAIVRLKYDLDKARNQFMLFENNPDAQIIRNTRGLMNSMQQQVGALQEQVPSGSDAVADITVLREKLEKFLELFTRAVNLNRVYLQLNNVVLAGFSAEIDKLTAELDALTQSHANNLTQTIKENNARSNEQILGLSLIAILLGISATWFIAGGISAPVRKMADALSKLAEGDKTANIPLDDRKDEVGNMAIAAHSFKEMATRIDVQRQELEEFAYRTSHDLRSPLVSSIGLLELCQKSLEEGDINKVQKMHGLSITNLKKLEALVKDILSLTEVQHKEEDTQNCNVLALIEESLIKIQEMEGFKEINIQMDIKANEVFCLKNRLSLIIDNLLTNAAKYQNPNEKQKYIKIGAVVTDGHFILSVEDNGVGIPLESQEQMFTMFKRFHPKIAYGSGLGLYMMKKSAEILGGKIEYEPTGEGSLFRLILPEYEGEMHV